MIKSPIVHYLRQHILWIFREKYLLYQICFSKKSISVQVFPLFNIITRGKLQWKGGNSFKPSYEILRKQS